MYWLYIMARMHGKNWFQYGGPSQEFVLQFVAALEESI